MPMHRYHFNLHGTIKEVNPPNKAIVHFTLNGQEERALLLAKMAVIVNEPISFDCHIYDKGGMGSGKDKCNFFAMKAWKQDDEIKGGAAYGSLARQTNNCKTDTGWLSEIYGNSGVITFTSSLSGVDQRVSFSANRLYFYEKRTDHNAYLPSILQLGDVLNFECIPVESNYEGSMADFCPFVALLVWRGKRPQVDMGSLLDPSIQQFTARKDSLDSSSSSDLNNENDNGLSNSSSFLILPTAGKPTGLRRGVGQVAKIVSHETGIIWWISKANYHQSVWFHRKNTFKFGYNLANKRLDHLLSEGDAVNLVVEKSPSNCGAKWSAKQILITDESRAELNQLLSIAGDQK